MDYRIKENKKSWTIVQKHENVTITINITKTICPTRKVLDAHLKEHKYIIGGE